MLKDLIERLDAELLENTNKNIQHIQRNLSNGLKEVIDQRIQEEVQVLEQYQTMQRQALETLHQANQKINEFNVFLDHLSESEKADFLKLSSIPQVVSNPEVVEVKTVHIDESKLTAEELELMREMQNFNL